MRPWPPSFSLANTKTASPLAILLPSYIVLQAVNVNALARALTTSALIAYDMIFPRYCLPLSPRFIFVGVPAKGLRRQTKRPVFGWSASQSTSYMPRRAELSRADAFLLAVIFVGLVWSAPIGPPRIVTAMNHAS